METQKQTFSHVQVSLNIRKHMSFPLDNVRDKH